MDPRTSTLSRYQRGWYLRDLGVFRSFYKDTSVREILISKLSEPEVGMRPLLKAAKP